ncbi:MAG: hypothetical protein OXR84_00705 [Magnetovibrio sp.]|nr:hypothetical protein [Magnetovibrio sp.]
MTIIDAIRPEQVPAMGLAAALILGFLAGCAVTGDADEVSVEHPAHQFLVAEIAADRHCRSFGRVARHLQTSPAQPSEIFKLQSRVSLFACEAP